MGRLTGDEIGARRTNPRHRHNAAAEQNPTHPPAHRAGGGRMTYALGLAFGLAALLALTDTSPRRRLILAALAAFLAAATSPVAGLFIGLAGAALIFSRRIKDGLTLGIAAVIPIGIVSGIFGEGGWMNISTSDTRH